MTRSFQKLFIYLKGPQNLALLINQGETYQLNLMLMIKEGLVQRARNLGGEILMGFLYLMNGEEKGTRERKGRGSGSRGGFRCGL